MSSSTAPTARDSSVSPRCATKISLRAATTRGLVSDGSHQDADLWVKRVEEFDGDCGGGRPLGSGGRSTRSPWRAGTVQPVGATGVVETSLA